MVWFGGGMVWYGFPPSSVNRGSLCNFYQNSNEVKSLERSIHTNLHKMSKLLCWTNIKFKEESYTTQGENRHEKYRHLNLGRYLQSFRIENFLEKFFQKAQQSIKLFRVSGELLQPNNTVY